MKGYAPGWQLRCTKCGLTFDAADMGIVRLAGRSWHQYKIRWCGQCRWLRFFAEERKPTDVPDPSGPRSDLATHARNLSR
jgi:hypothetical protein